MSSSKHMSASIPMSTPITQSTLTLPTTISLSDYKLKKDILETRIDGLLDNICDDHYDTISILRSHSSSNISAADFIFKLYNKDLDRSDSRILTDKLLTLYALYTYLLFVEASTEETIVYDELVY